jgi:hypothetical protein
MLKLIDQRKQEKLQWLHNPSEINGDNLNYIRRLAGVSVTKPATSSGVSRVTVSKDMSAYINQGKAASAAENQH